MIHDLFQRSEVKVTIPKKHTGFTCQTICVRLYFLVKAMWEQTNLIKQRKTSDTKLKLKNNDIIYLIHIFRTLKMIKCG